MDYEEFEELAKEAGATQPYRYGRGFSTELCFYTEWVKGGVTGNSCWGRDPRPVSVEDPSTNIPEFDKFLLNVTPGINFMQYRVLESEVLVKDSYTNDPDYYNNYYEYGYLSVNVKTLYEKLIELNILPNPENSSGFSM